MSTERLPTPGTEKPGRQETQQGSSDQPLPQHVFNQPALGGSTVDAAASKADRILVFKEDRSLGGAHVDTGISSHPLFEELRKAS